MKSILTPPTKLPALEPELEEHGYKVIEKIVKEIKQHNGKITFAGFMDLALYAPGLGYYSAGLQKFGRAGDFVTAPEISPLFGQCIANQCHEIFLKLKNPCLLELGAGTGQCAVQIVTALSKKNCLPQKYYILEISADLREKQQQLLKIKCPYYYDNIFWLDNLDDLNFEGIIFANEVLDALPVHRFVCENDIIDELYVTYKNNEFQWLRAKPSDATLIKSVSKLKQNYFIDNEYYESEINCLFPMEALIF